ncbi:hypothetical protein EON65_34655 [archaeon]|nr:MAG: hypothetical protein EON65_34655 [archaeon]
MDDAHAEILDTKKKRVPISQQPGALPGVSWSPDRPRPTITPSIWTDDEAEEIAKYVDWHRTHPHTVTPRKAQMTADGEVIGGKYFHEDDSSLVYSHIGFKPNPLPEEFQPRFIGIDCDTDEVSVVASRSEYTEHLLHNEQVTSISLLK